MRIFKNSCQQYELRLSLAIKSSKHSVMSDLSLGEYERF